MDDDTEKFDSRPRPDPTKLTTEQIVRELAALEKVISERIHGIELLTEEKFRASTIAVSAALQAAKEAAGKSEVATEKQIDRIVALIEQRASTTDIQISDVKDRMNRGDGKGMGLQSAWGYLIGLTGLVAAIVMAFRK